MSNIFKEIWKAENHPTYNHFLATINIISNNINKLPKTRTSKNGIRAGDIKLENLYNWIRSMHPSPHRELSNAISERELVNELKKLKETHIRSADKHIEREFEVFKELENPVKVDLYVFDGQDTVLYEAKKGIADVQNLYQLIMYWDGAVYDGIIPTEGVLIASDFSENLTEIIEYFNEKHDQNGNNYHIIMKKWEDENIKLD